MSRLTLISGPVQRITESRPNSDLLLFSAQYSWILMGLCPVYAIQSLGGFVRYMKITLVVCLVGMN